MHQLADCQPVRWRRTEYGAKGVLTFCESRSALIVGRGRKWLHVIPTEAPVRIVKVPLEDERNMQPLLLRGEPYPVARCVRIQARLRRSAGGTDEAKELLARLSATRTLRAAGNVQNYERAEVIPEDIDPAELQAEAERVAQEKWPQATEAEDATSLIDL